jgi:hypothetical protein
VLGGLHRFDGQLVGAAHSRPTRLAMSDLAARVSSQYQQVVMAHVPSMLA